jgi:hypothetical protein
MLIYCKYKSVTDVFICYTEANDNAYNQNHFHDSLNIHRVKNVSNKVIDLNGLYILLHVQMLML